MQILLALIFGASVGAAWHFLLPHRALRGAALAPMVGALIGGGVWLWLTWLGQTTESVWLWLAAVVAPIAIVPIIITIVTRIRVAGDAKERARVGI